MEKMTAGAAALAVSLGAFSFVPQSLPGGITSFAAEAETQWLSLGENVVTAKAGTETKYDFETDDYGVYEFSCENAYGVKAGLARFEEELQPVSCNADGEFSIIFFHISVSGSKSGETRR